MESVAAPVAPGDLAEAAPQDDDVAGQLGQRDRSPLVRQSVGSGG